MKVITLYDTRFGNTERIAKSLEAGMKQVEGIQSVVCVNVKDDISIDSLEEYDLVCVGAPTEGFTASKSIKKFLEKLKGIDTVDKYGFAFDTKLDSHFSGSAAKFIEKELSNQGFEIMAPHQSAIVLSVKEGGTITSARLKEGEEERFRKIGTQLGRALEAKARSIQS